MIDKQRAETILVPALETLFPALPSLAARAYPGAGASVGPSWIGGYVAANHALGASR